MIDNHGRHWHNMGYDGLNIWKLESDHWHAFIHECDGGFLLCYTGGVRAPTLEQAADLFTNDMPKRLLQKAMDNRAAVLCVADRLRRDGTCSATTATKN
jgi:hypothetical protein